MSLIQTTVAAIAMLAAGATLAAAGSEDNGDYLVCKPGYELNALKTACVKK